jgi:hypothetical protein
MAREVDLPENIEQRRLPVSTGSLIVPGYLGLPSLIQIDIGVIAWDLAQVFSDKQNDIV